MANIPFLNNASFSAAITVANSATASNFITTTDSGININGITLTRVAANSAIRVGNGLETLGLLRSYSNLIVATTGAFGGDVSVEDNLYLTDSGTVRGKIQLNSSDRDDLDIKAVSLGSNMKFFTVDTERMRITSTGNVGIGAIPRTINTYKVLDISGSGGAGGYIGLSSGSTQQGELYSHSAGVDLVAVGAKSTRFFTNAVERMRINSSGNVGIGTTSPDGVLHIKKDNATATFEIQGGLNTQTTAGAINGEINFGVNDASTTGGIGASIKNISEISNGAHNGLAFFTGLQSRTPYLQQMLYFTARGGLSFGTTNNSYGTSGQILKSNADAPPSWVDASTVIGGPYLPLAGGTMTGNTDHNDNVYSKYGTADQLRIWNNGSNSYIFNYTSGHINIGNDAVDKDVIFYADRGDGLEDVFFRLDGSETNGTTVLGVTLFPDKSQVRFGNQGDLRIYHDGSNSYIQDTGTGSLKILAQDFDLNNAAETASMIRAIDGAQVELYYGGSKKLETTSTGIAITGNLDSPQISVNDYISHNGDTDTYFGFPAANEFKLVAGGSNKFAADANAAYMYYQGGAKFQTTNTGVTVTGAATATTFLGDLNGTINTATTAVTKANATNDTTVATTAFVQNLIGTIPAGLVFQGTWNAATNTPTLTSGSGTTGHFYIVSTDGSTNLDGITDWKVGDWAVFVEQGASDQWEKVDNSSVLDGSGTGGSIAGWAGSGTSNTLTNAPITFSGNNTTFAGDINFGDSHFIGDDADDNLLIQGSANENIIIDSADDLILDAGGNDIRFKVNSVEYGKFKNDSSDFAIFSSIQDKDILFKGNDGGSTITALALDMSEGGNATFAGRVMADTHFQSSDANATLSATGTGNIYLRPNGYSTTTGQVHINTSGNATFAGNIVGDGTLDTQGTITVGNGQVVLGGTGRIQGVDTVSASTDAANKAYVDAHGGGLGPFLPLAGGTMTGDLKLNDNVVAKFGTGNDLRIQHVSGGSGAGYIQNYTGDLQIQNRAADKDILFRADDGSGVVTSYLVLDGSTTHAYFSNPGNVGIGTTSPAYKLDVAGNIRVDSTSVAQIFLDSAASNDAVLNFHENASQKGKIGYDTSLGGIALVAGSGAFSTAGMVLLDDGNVGIGTTSPNRSLHVIGQVAIDNSTSPSGGLLVSPDGNSNKVYSRTGNATSSAHPLDFISGSSTSMRIATNGNVGIGTTSPTHLLTLETASSPGIKIKDTTQGATLLAFSQDSNSHLGTYSAHPLVLDTNSTERLRITSAGNVGIGTTSPISSLDVNGTISLSGETENKLYKASTSPVTGVVTNTTVLQGRQIDLYALDDIVLRTGTSASDDIIFFAGNSEKARIKGSGNVGIGTTGPSSKLQVEAAAGQATTLNNSVANSALRINADTANGSNNIRIGESGSGSYFLQVSNSAGTTPYAINLNPFGGNVGIGTTSPQNLLHLGDNTNSIAGTIRIDSFVANQFWKLEPGTNTLNIKDYGGTSLVSFDGNSNFVLFNGGNVGIGSTSPSEKLEVSGGHIKITNSGNTNLYINANNSGSDATIYFEELDSIKAKIQHDASNDSMLFTDGSYTDTMTLKGGNVGIGTTSPGYKLEVAGTARITSALTLGGNVNNRIEGTGSSLDFKSNGEYYFRKGANTHLTILSSGNVGIGTTNPTNKLHIQGSQATVYNSTDSGGQASAGTTINNTNTAGNTNNFSQLLFTIGTNNNSVSRIVAIRSGSDASDLAFVGESAAGVAEYMRIKSGGNVGIGTTSPSQKLDVNGVVQSDRFFVGTNASANQWAVQVRNNASTADSGIYFNNDSSEIYLRNSSNVIGARIRSNSASYFNGGDVGIGTASPQERLHVSGETHPSIKLSSSSDGNYNVILNCGYRNEALNLSVGGYKVFTTEGFNTPETTHLYSNNSKALSLASNQAATFTSTVTATNFINSSDERLKENIEEVRDNNVEVNWKTFNFKTEKEQKRYGVIAQELEKTNPEFVREDSQGFKSVAYIDLLIAKIAELEARIQKLENK